MLRRRASTESKVIVPLVPTSSPRLQQSTYDLILQHLLLHDRRFLLDIIRSWPRDIYDIQSLMRTTQGELDATPNETSLLDCMGEMYMKFRQPGKALSYFLRLRKPFVFDLIREHNLFSAVQDQALQLIDFDLSRDAEDRMSTGRHGPAIQLLVDHIHSIPVSVYHRCRTS